VFLAASQRNPYVTSRGEEISVSLMPNCPTLPSRLSALGLATRGVAGVLCVFGLIALFAVAKPAPVAASPQQAPNSRVVLDLPSSYTPSPLFSGFQDDARGVSFVILEAPASEYDKMAQGFTAAEFAKRGITDASTKKFQRSDPHIFMRARQKSAAGTYQKFFVLFRTKDQTVLVSSNVPARAVADGSVTVDEIEKVLATATTAGQPAVHDIFSLSHLGPFKEAGTLVGTSKVYTLDGRLEPERAGVTRSAFMVAPSLDKRTIGNPKKEAVALLESLSGYKGIKTEEPHEVTIGGLPAVETWASAIDEDDNVPVRLYQALVECKDGGYFRLIGIATPRDVERLNEEFPKIAGSFALVP
jgi:hypothetical protein